MSSRSSVYVHQGSSPSSPSRPSSSASYGSSDSRSVSNRREYDAAGHAAQVIRSGKTVVINHNRKDYEKGSPSPRYGGGYQ
ncbi:uncharacterized protein TRIREDRAFT_107802 [Trichoderma reesei QM6a]|uniref:Predicted protein n=2 Tax=Hypocrea jecorina TaxID=51453 RepID=G0RKC3_HYPJQ|nr:uncharacterized protein TRIREDRAFT_107802 [Trichoderma reesei QM6a]EGR48416.1 predicted protein [Trichoderma reesei QM6a]ETS07039.1 hypothetical protein M419DRAFT_67719 [Trichoderma reesei RUT C-30]